MFTFPFERSVLPFPGISKFAEAFPEPVAFYFRHRDDIEFVLPTACFADFSAGTLTCFDPHSDANRSSMAAIPGNPFGIGMDRLFDPHWFVRLNDGSYLLFFQRRRYFYRFFPDRSEFSAMFPEDIGLPSEVDEFGATNFLHPDGSVTFLVHETYANRNKYSVYRSDPSFSDFKKICSGHTRSGNIPHVIVPYGKGFLLSDFYYNEFHFRADSAKTRLNEESVLETVYRKLLEGYFSESGQDPAMSRTRFREFIKNSPKGVVPVGPFRTYVWEKFRAADCKGIKEYCDATGLRFDAFPGEITYLDPESGTESVFETTYSNPAHFEVDPETGDVYVSSHNFNYLNRLVLEYFGPAAIDRFEPDADSGFRRAATFSVPDGYRFTSHRVVRSGKERRVATFGQPNRFFWISAPDLGSAERLDVLPNRLSELAPSQDSVKRYLRREGSEESVTIKAIEASRDGSGTVFALSSDRAFAFVPSDGGILTESYGMPFPEDFSGMRGSEVFTCRTTHCNYVR